MSVLAAGGIGAGPATDPDLDTITARAYRHAALDGRTVVRLTAAAVGPAEDLSMEFLGFTGAGTAEVGHGARQALGFPAWVLVHDPDNARHALAMVPEMAKLARVARSKPGNARDGYRALAERLGAAAPRLLPTFWEQAGRSYLAVDNPKMAGVCFTEARKAEQVHGLVVDEARVRDVHLEYAFAGALTGSMLSAYARDVIGRTGEVEAYELVKSLSLRRVAGGVPPHGTMAADLSRLARAAGRDAEREADEVAGLLLTYPATARGPAGLWKAYRKSLIRLGEQDAGVRTRLLEIFPSPPWSEFPLGDLWLDLLDATGAIGDLLDGGAAAWLTRFRNSGLGVSNAVLMPLIERLAPRLTAEGGLTLADQPSAANVELLDLCLSLGIPARIGAVEAGSRLTVLSWSPGARDLTAIAADPVLRPLLKEGARLKFGRQRGSTSLSTPPLPDRILLESFGAPGVRDVLAELVGELAGSGTLAGLDDALVQLGALWSPGGVALAPDAFRRLLAADLPGLLAGSLRAGLLAELTWPAYEEAASRLTQPSIGIGWPELVLHDERSAQVVTPGGQVVEHVFPSAGGTRECTFVDGDLLVLRFTGGYWASRPNEVFPVGLRMTVGSPDPLPVPGGGLTVGGRPLRRGDRRSLGASTESFPLATDGLAFWRCEPSADGDRWREFDPRTGDAGRVSVPEFFAVPGLVPARSWMRPLPPEFADSPLGSPRPLPPEHAGSPIDARGGLAGWRVTEESGDLLAGEGLDGRRVTLPQRSRHRDSLGTDREALVGAVLLPGADEPLAVTRVWGHPHGEVRLWTADGQLLTDEPYLTGTLPPVEWWHAMRARDSAGSAALRKLDTATAAALLDSFAGERSSAAGRVAALLPEVTDPVLLDAVVARVARADELRRRLAQVTGLLEPVVRKRPPVTDSALRLAWDGLASTKSTYTSGGPADPHQIATQIQRVGTLLASPDTSDPNGIPTVGAGWMTLLGGLGAVALRAAAAITGDEQRAALTWFLGAVAGTPLDGSGPPIRVLEVVQQRMVPDEVTVSRDDRQVTLLFPPEVHHFSIGNTTQWRRPGIQMAPDGVFTLPDGLSIREEVRPSGRLTGERLRAFVALLADRGPVPQRPEAVSALVAATGMAWAEAALLLAGLPGMAMWEDNFLTPAQRKALGLTPAQAKVGRAGLRELSFAQRVALLDAAMPADPEVLWTDGPDVAAIAEKWIGLRGRRVSVPDDLVFDLGKVIEDAQAADVLRAIAGPADGDWLSTDGRTDASNPWRLATESDQGVPFDGRYLIEASVALPWLGYRLAWDDPLRTALPGALRLVRDRLRNPELLVGRDSHPAGEMPDAGPALVEGAPWARYVFHHLAPARLSGIDDPAIGFVDEATATALRTVLSDWIDEVVATPAGAKGDPHDPRVSVPDLVDAVRERHGLDADAATHYLQLLALPGPVDKSVQKWNGWSPKALRAAQQTLTDAGLVIAAKRARAGRQVFLPGGWQAARAPRLPVETWKISMYGDLGVPPMPVPRLFRTAWGRVTDGDVPRYHDLEETR